MRPDEQWWKEVVGKRSNGCLDPVGLIHYPRERNETLDRKTLLVEIRGLLREWNKLVHLRKRVRQRPFYGRAFGLRMKVLTQQTAVTIRHLKQLKESE